MISLSCRQTIFLCCVLWSAIPVYGSFREAQERNPTIQAMRQIASSAQSPEDLVAKMEVMVLNRKLLADESIEAGRSVSLNTTSLREKPLNIFVARVSEIRQAQSPPEILIANLETYFATLDLPEKRLTVLSPSANSVKQQISTNELKIVLSDIKTLTAGQIIRAIEQLIVLNPALRKPNLSINE